MPKGYKHYNKVIIYTLKQPCNILLLSPLKLMAKKQIIDLEEEDVDPPEELSKPEQARQMHLMLSEYKRTKDKRVRDKIVKANVILVKKIAHGLARRSTDPVEDLIQIGSIGLIKAVDYFDPDAGAKFTTYATHLVTGEIRHYLRDKTSMIRAPRELQELSFRINRIVHRLRTELGRDPTNVEIAEVLQDVKPHKIQEAFEVDRRRTLVSLDQSLTANSSSDSDTYLVDTLMDMREHKRRDAREEFLVVKDFIDKLRPNLREIIDLIYFQDIPQADVANMLGISQMQVSRRLKKATAALQELIAGSGRTEKKQRKITIVQSSNPSPKATVVKSSGSKKKASRSSLGAKLEAQKRKGN